IKPKRTLTNCGGTEALASHPDDLLLPPKDEEGSGARVDPGPLPSPPSSLQFRNHTQEQQRHTTGVGERSPRPYPSLCQSTSSEPVLGESACNTLPAHNAMEGEPLGDTPKTPIEPAPARILISHPVSSQRKPCDLPGC